MPESSSASLPFLDVATATPAKKRLAYKRFILRIKSSYYKIVTLEEINEMIIAYNAPDDLPPTGGGDDNEESEKNSGTLILDATCAPQNISYPQDVNLLNEAREKLEQMIDIICYEQNYYKPRTYRQKA